MDILIDRLPDASDINSSSLVELACFVMEALDLPENSEVSVSFVDSEEMAELNRTWRGIEGPTDVLSFECDNIDDGFLAGDGAALAHEMGDIVIATDVARRQAHEYGHSVQDEVELLLVHGLLHLCGYDHIEEAEAVVMEGKEDDLLSQWRRREGR